jgi:hypothetical protein
LTEDRELDNQPPSGGFSLKETEMTITATVTPARELTRVTTISHLDDAGSPAAAAYDVGFVPRYIRVENVTDRICNEWMEGMASGHALRTVAAGTRTLETSGGPTLTAVDTVGFPVLQNKQYRVIVQG